MESGRGEELIGVFIDIFWAVYWNTLDITRDFGIFPSDSV